MATNQPFPILSDNDEDLRHAPRGGMTHIGDHLPQLLLGLMVKNLRTVYAVRVTRLDVLNATDMLFGEDVDFFTLPSNFPVTVIHHIVEERNTRAFDAVPRDQAPTVCEVCETTLVDAPYPCGGGHQCNIRICGDECCANNTIIRIT